MTLRRLASGEVYTSLELAELGRVAPPPPMPKAKSLRVVEAPAKVMPPITDRGLLEALRRAQVMLYPRELEAFGRMLSDMRAGRFRALSYRQRAWAQEVGARVGIPGVEAPADWRDV